MSQESRGITQMMFSARIDVIEFVDIAAALGVVPGDILAQVESTGHFAKRTAHRSRKA
jgi:hypothetical protein